MSQASAETATLRTVSAFTPGTAIPHTFEMFLEEIENDTEAPIDIDFIGGPETMPPFQVGNAVSNGVVDMAFVTSAFYTSSLPAAHALNLTRYSPEELRETGRFEQLQEMWREQMNVHYLAYTNYGNRYHLYLNEPISSPELNGLRMRITPVYRAFVEEMGGEAAQTPPGEVYTALERGTVDGYGWPIQGIFDLGWQEHTRYRVDPGFYHVEVGVLVNQDTWDNLTDEQRNYLTEKAIWLEEQNALNEEINAEEERRQAEAGIETIEFEGEERERYLEMAYRVQWERLAEEHAGNAERLREILDSE
ncbi:TRAP transporter substrate-binding protein DctP [Halomonas sp. MCCC 1A17488]|uniref:TRAP transporter substrate-binding protein DctP n=2 Tax=Oceanospirillales TaxID=135619 RepID=A0ABX7WD50_9GAMM|nr:TRAP transporter substrate-binding protein DctP [Halomonas sp. MCCC 1A17488]MCG3239115.1 TRAP transporter substrate-binding protein DctP [Halomonas sp. MCCC 1A17488]QTP57013.1 TRAP transporter substrate-binding protein DctP [Halomonas sulfidoxydans]